VTRVVVVGAGIIGLAGAAELARRGASVVVVERAGAGAGTSSRGEGNLLVSDKEIPAEARMALRSLQLWHELAATSPEPFEFEPKGGIVTAATAGQLDLLAAQAARQRDLGITADVLGPDELAAHEPGLAAGLAGGLWFPQDAQVMPIHAVRALRRVALDLGVVERTGVTAVGLTARPGGVRLRLDDGTDLDADAVVVAAGPWSGEVAQRLGGTAAVFPRRGLLLVTERRPAGTVRHKVYDGRYVEAVASGEAAALVAPVIESTPSGTILIGSTREAVGWDERVRWDLAGELAAGARQLFPALADAQVIRTYQGFRPATPDHLPLVGPDARMPGLFHASGHEGAGIGLALASAEVLADAVLDGLVDPAFDPRRFTPAAPAAPSPAAPHPRGRVTFVWGSDTTVTRLEGKGDPPSERNGDGVPPGFFCGIGHCHGCASTDAGSGRTVRPCLAPAPRGDTPPAEASAGRPTTGETSADGLAADELVVDGLVVDVLVVGAGPGGLAAAAGVVAAGRRVAVIDRYDAAGGQIGRQPDGATTPTGPWADLISAGSRMVLHLGGAAVTAVHRTEPVGPAVHDGGRFEALVVRHGRLGIVRADHVVLATGAREVVAPFPGWTLPGVITAGALQALLKRDVRRPAPATPWRRVGLAGSGPLLLAVAEAARAAGQAPAFLLEARRATALARRGLPTARRHPTKAADFARLAGRHPPRFGWRVREAVGGDAVAAAVIFDRRGRTRTVPLDALAVSDGLVPDIALAVQLGCATREVPGTAGPAVVVDGDQRTSVDGVLAVGEVTGVGGADKAVAEGRLAGAILAGVVPAGDALSALRESAARWRAFADDLAALYPWDDGWVARLPAEEVVCRCESVPLAAVTRAIADGAHTARAVKGLTRCGMGPCQGAVCGPLVRTALLAAGHPTPGTLDHRPLAEPVPLDELARLARSG
jgi:glycine/D-amino acid oxidase-like deaminating enzyme